MMKNEGDHCGTHALFISPFFNNYVFSLETLWVYTTIGTLHTDTLKTSFQRVKQYCVML
jgi:hypothetical protein